MQKKEALGESGYIIHVLQPQANGSSAAACGSSGVVLTIAVQHVPLISLSAICPRCRDVLGIEEPDELRKTLQIAAFLRSMPDHNAM